MPPVTLSINWIMYGGALVTIIFLVILLMRGDFVTGREYRSAIEIRERECKAAIEVRDKRIVELQDDLKRLAEEKNREIILWRDLTFRTSDLADVLTQTLPPKRSGV